MKHSRERLFIPREFYAFEGLVSQYVMREGEAVPPSDIEQYVRETYPQHPSSAAMYTTLSDSIQAGFAHTVLVSGGNTRQRGAYLPTSRGIEAYKEQLAHQPEDIAAFLGITVATVIDFPFFRDRFHMADIAAEIRNHPERNLHVPQL